MTSINFLTLPRELRDGIYEQCFYERIFVIPHSKSAFMSLLRVCRQVYNASIPYFYAKNTFCLSLDAKDPEDRYSDWPEQQKILESHLSQILDLNICLFLGRGVVPIQHVDSEGAWEKLQWLVDTLIRTGENKGEFLLKELSMEDILVCYCMEPSMLPHIPDEAEDSHIEAAREFYQRPVEALKGKVGVETRKLTLDHELWF